MVSRIYSDEMSLQTQVGGHPNLRNNNFKIWRGMVNPSWNPFCLTKQRAHLPLSIQNIDQFSLINLMIGIEIDLFLWLGFQFLNIKCF